MQQVKNGDTVHVHYTGRLTNGNVFDSSAGREPLQFTAGSGQVIKGFDNAVVDMTIGDKKTVNIPVHEAYGARNEDMIITYPLEQFPQDMNPQVGMELHMSDNMGNHFPVVIVEIENDMAILDANHPLAGEDLIFDIELVQIG